ncbi:hypothetical protein J7M23_03620 [Candidatus Sumerlaeota bacterium]|nr:hypothetical protein [Candidatus Sumerlaeota bacterium]
MVQSDKALLEKLNKLFADEYHSFTEAILNAAPYVDESMKEAEAVLKRIVEQEKEHARLLGELIYKLDGVPDTETYNTDIGDINYLSLQALLPRIIRFKREQLERYRAMVKECGIGLDEVRSLMRRLANATAEQLKSLEPLLSQLHHKK